MKKLTHSFGTGAIALVFAVLGYQTALLIHHSATSKIIANRDAPDTVYVVGNPVSIHGAGEGTGTAANGQGPEQVRETGGARNYVRKNAAHSQQAMNIRKQYSLRKVENFRFDPNNCSEEDFMRLGFSQKQAQSIINYRKKGGRFRRKEDFAKSYVVADSVYERLAPYIDIPRIDLNKADSATFDLLPGIGGWYASKMVKYRASLGGYSNPEQLMDIKGIDEDKYNAFKDLICIQNPFLYPLWELPADSLARHPYIKSKETARSIVFYRNHNPKDKWTVEGLLRAGLLSPSAAEKLSGCTGVPEN